MQSFAPLFEVKEREREREKLKARYRRIVFPASGTVLKTTSVSRYRETVLTSRNLKSNRAFDRHILLYATILNVNILQ